MYLSFEKDKIELESVRSTYGPETDLRKLRTK